MLLRLFFGLCLPCSENITGPSRVLEVCGNRVVMRAVGNTDLASKQGCAIYQPHI